MRNVLLLRVGHPIGIRDMRLPGYYSIRLCLLQSVHGTGTKYGTGSTTY